MPVTSTPIEGLLVCDWPTHDDSRGFFRQTHHLEELTAALGREPVLVQGNHSRSRPGVLRGFHADEMDKLFYVVRGAAVVVVADIRTTSPTFGETFTLRMGDAADARQVRLFISEGLANAFCTYGDGPTDCVYDVGAYYRPDVPRRAVAWDDPDLDITWPVTDPVLSSADAANPRLRDLVPDHPRWS